MFVWFVTTMALVIRCNDRKMLTPQVERTFSVFKWCDGIRELKLSCNRTNVNAYRATAVLRMCDADDVNAYGLGVTPDRAYEAASISALYLYMARKNSNLHKDLVFVSEDSKN